MIEGRTGKVDAILVTVALMGIMSATPSHAGQLSAIVNGKSFHVGALQDWNENNYGFGLEYEFSSESQWKWKVMANGFVDSLDNLSYMVGGGLHRRILENARFQGVYFDIGLNAFLMVRDDVNDDRPFPGALPSISFGNRYVGANLTYLPRRAVELMYRSDDVDRGITGIVFLQIKLDAALFGVIN